MPRTSQPTRRRRRAPDQSGFIRQIMIVGLVFVMLFAIGSVYKHVAAQSTTAAPEIRSGIAGYCLDDHHDSDSKDAAVDAWTCNGSDAQNWTVVSQTIKHGDKQCLAVADNGTRPGSQVVANPCDGSAGQNWTIDIGGFQNPASGLCLDAPANKPGQQLIVTDCGDMTALGKAWAADTWQAKPETASCATGTKGQQVACYAEKQWAAWQSGSPSHKALLNEYSDGNSYEEWCADFVSYVYKQAGYPFENGERGAGGWDEYDANDVQDMGFTMHSPANYTPQPGDVAYFNYPGGHVELVVSGGKHPTFIYGNSNTTDPTTGNGEMNKDTITVDGSDGQVAYYLSPN